MLPQDPGPMWVGALTGQGHVAGYELEQSSGSRKTDLDKSSEQAAGEQRKRYIIDMPHPNRSVNISKQQPHETAWYIGIARQK